MSEGAYGVQHKEQEQELWSQSVCLCSNLAMPLTSYVTLDKLSNLSMPHLCHQ